jgi:hypothetical protein
MGKSNLQSAHVRSSALLCVYPNVFAVADHLGRLSAAVRFDPDHGRQGSVHFVGAQVNRRPREGFIRTARNEKGVRQTIFDVTVKHSLKVQKLPHSGFFKRQIKDGSLIPADEATARLAGVKFVDPPKALEQARKKLIDELLTMHSEEVVNRFAAAWPKFTLGDQPQTDDKPAPRKPPPANEDVDAVPTDADKPAPTKTDVTDNDDGKETEEGE